MAGAAFVYFLRASHLMPILANRYVAGSDVQAALAATLKINRHGLLGCVTPIDRAETAEQIHRNAATCEQVIELISLGSVHANLSISLAQLGFHRDAFLANELAYKLATVVVNKGSFLWIDTDPAIDPKDNLETVVRLNRIPGFHGRIGLTVQADHYGVHSDISVALKEAIPVRLRERGMWGSARETIKGATKIRRNYLRSMGELSSSCSCAFFTNDLFLIERVLELQKQNPMRDFELQVFYGIRPPEAIVHAPSPARVIIPFGSDAQEYVGACCRQELKRIFTQT